MKKISKINGNFKSPHHFRVSTIVLKNVVKAKSASNKCRWMEEFFNLDNITMYYQILEKVNCFMLWRNERIRLDSLISLVRRYG